LRKKFISGKKEDREKKESKNIIVEGKDKEE